MDCEEVVRSLLYVVGVTVNFRPSRIVNSFIVELNLYISPYYCNYTADDVVVATLVFRVSLALILIL